MQISLAVRVCSLLVKSPGKKNKTLHPAAFAARKQEAEPNKQVEKRTKGSEMAELLQLPSHSGRH